MTAALREAFSPHSMASKHPLSMTRSTDWEGRGKERTSIRMSGGWVGKVSARERSSARERRDSRTRKEKGTLEEGTALAVLVGHLLDGHARQVHVQNVVEAPLRVQVSSQR